MENFEVILSKKEGVYEVEVRKYDGNHYEYACTHFDDKTDLKEESKIFTSLIRKL